MLLSCDCYVIDFLCKWEWGSMLLQLQVCSPSWCPQVYTYASNVEETVNYLDICLLQICYVLHGGRLGTFNHVTDVNASGRQGGPDWETKCFIYMFFFNPEKCKICWVFQLAFSLFPPTIVLSVTLTRANHTIISLTQWLSQLEHGRPFARLRVRVPFFLNDFDQVK